MIRAFEKAVELQGETVLRPKALGISGVCLIFTRCCIHLVVEVPEEDAEKMEIKRLLWKKE